MQNHTRIETDSYGTKRYLNEKGQPHRLDGPAIEWSDGAKWWYQNGQLHRLDGPAVEYDDGTKYWLQNGQLHRLDGPAIEYANGTKYWYIRDRYCSEAEFLAILATTLNLNLSIPGL